MSVTVRPMNIDPRHPALRFLPPGMRGAVPWHANGHTEVETETEAEAIQAARLAVLGQDMLPLVAARGGGSMVYRPVQAGEAATHFARSDGRVHRARPMVLSARERHDFEAMQALGDLAEAAWAMYGPRE